MKRERVTELHYIVPIENLPSIAEHGLLSHDRVKGLPHTSVALDSVQQIRATKRVPRGGRLHQYVNLYFHARNSMMYYLRRNDARPIVVLRITPSVLDVPHAAISDGNAASDMTRFFPSPTGINALDESFVYAESWNHDDFWIKRERRRRRCAEVLIPHHIPAPLISGIIALDAATRDAGKELNWPGEVNPYVFFE